MADSDLYAGTRAAALQILDQCGLFSGSGAVSRDTVATLLESRVQLSGPTKPFIPSPFRISEFVAGAHAAMAALCILLEQKKGGRGAGDALEASIDVEHASFVLYAPFILKWFTPEFEDLVKEAPLVDPKVVNEGGCWTEINMLLNSKLMKEMAKASGTPPAPPGPVPGEVLTDPPPGTSSLSPIYTSFRFFLSNVFKTKDRHIFLFPRLTDDPAKFLSALRIPDSEIPRLLRLAITNPATHPTTYVTHHSAFLSYMKSHMQQQGAFDMEDRIKAINAIAVVPRTRQEFDQTNQGQALSQVPRVGIERTGSVRAPRSLAEWTAFNAGTLPEDTGHLWPDTTWKAGPLDYKAPGRRGILHGVKVLEIVRMVAGPMIGLQLAQLGADVMRVNSADIMDYPAYDMGMNLNKRTVELDLKSAAGKAKLRELIMEADVITANLLAGSMDKLGFGYKDVLEIIKGRGKGIVYAETNTFGFFGELASLPGIENLGQMISGVAMTHGQYTPYSPPQPVPVPTITPVLVCDITTGLNTAVGVLSALYKRSTIGGSYLVRSSLTQTGLALQDLGIYKDPEMIRSLWDGYPLHEAEMVPDSTTVKHNGQLDYLLKFGLWMRDRKVRGTTWESGFWLRTKNNPFGGTIQSLLPPIKLSTDPSNYAYLRFCSRPLRYDSHVGFAFDYEDRQGSDEEVRELVESGEMNTWVCRSERETNAEILKFLGGKGKLRGVGEQREARL